MMCPSCKKGVMYIVVEGVNYIIYECTHCGYRHTVVYRRER